MAGDPDLNSEVLRLTQFLRGRVVKQVWRNRSGEIGIEFDGVRLFVDSSSELEISITGTDEEDG